MNGKVYCHGMYSLVSPEGKLRERSRKLPLKREDAKKSCSFPGIYYEKVI